MKQIWKLLLFLAAGAALLSRPQVAAEAVRTGLSLCAGAILPGLFPFFVLSELWIRSGSADHAALLAAPMTRKLFHLPGSAAPALLLGAVGGYPMGAAVTARLYTQGRLSRQEAEQTLYCCNNAGPAFLISVVGSALGSIAAGVALYAIHLGAALFVGLLHRPAGFPRPTQPEKTANATPLAQCLTQAIPQAGQTAQQVCIFVLFFSLLAGLLQSILPATLPPLLHLILAGLLELTGGIHLLAQAGLSPRLAFVLCAALVGFGGLCVQMQSRSLLAASGLSGRTLLRGKLLQALISAALAWLLWPILPATIPCIRLSLPESCFPAAQLLLVPVCLCFLALQKSSSGKQAENRL